MTDFAPRKGMTQADIVETIAAVLAEASLAEKVGMMSGAGFFKAFVEDERVWAARPYRAGGGIGRFEISPFYFTDGPRGVARGQSTCFPCSMARGATFDPDLEQRIGEVMGIEARAQGCTLSGAVCFNLLRHPAWGRAQETYGEDTFHLGEMGAALATGIQTHNVAATIKHFALNSMENARFKVDVQIDERALHEVYLPHFKRAVDAGCATVMSAYNKMNGEYCGQNSELLTDILRGEWGFDGFVHSDWVMGVYDLKGAEAGLDVENPEPRVFGAALIAAVENGDIAPAVVDLACERILRVYYRFACAEDPLPAYAMDLVTSPAHIAIAREAAEKSAVLLKNNGVLPLVKGKIGTLAVLGKLATAENIGDNGSSKVSPPYIVTALEGLKRASNAVGIGRILTGDEDDLAAARQAAAAADVVIVVVGNTVVDEGEFIPGDIALGANVPEEMLGQARAQSIGGDRDDLGLRAEQIALIQTVAAIGKPVIVVIVSGSAIMVEEWHERASAILQTFYSGMEGGTALARLLFGEVSPSGKLPFTVAKSADDYPFFNKDACQITYDMWHGYSLLDRDGKTPRYAFGHGLSYAEFSYGALRAQVDGEYVRVEVSVTNSSAVAGDEVVQAYVSFPGLEAERQPKLLKGFKRIRVEPGATLAVQIDVPLESLKWRDPVTHSWRFEAGEYGVHVGSASDRLKSTRVML